MLTEEKALTATETGNSGEKKTQEELLQKLAEESAVQTVMARKQLNLTRLSTIFVGIMTAAVVLFVGAVLPKVNTTLANADQVLQSLGEVAVQLEEADLQGILANLNRTLAEGQESLRDASEALEKVSQIDFDSLNQAINDLSNLLNNPLGALFG
jgi:hypothetical protein